MVQSIRNGFSRALACVCLVAGLTAAMPVLAGAPADAAAGRAAATKAWAVILDPQVPLATRRQTLAQLEKATRGDDQWGLYWLGSLYWMGQHASGAPVQQNLPQAAIYMGNAAIHGSLLGMAKTAEIDLAMHKYAEAMIWAQVYGHYVMQLPRGERPNEGYIAELLQRIIDKLGNAGVARAMPQVASFIALHDAQIRAGSNSDFAGKRPQPMAKGQPYVTPGYRLEPESGMVDYLLVFRADGSQAHTWLLDALPDPVLGEALKRYASQVRLAPEKASAGHGPRYRWLPIMFDDHRYRIAR